MHARAENAPGRTWGPPSEFALFYYVFPFHLVFSSTFRPFSRHLKYITYYIKLYKHIRVNILLPVGRNFLSAFSDSFKASPRQKQTSRATRSGSSNCGPEWIRGAGRAAGGAVGLREVRRDEPGRPHALQRLRSGTYDRCGWCGRS